MINIYFILSFGDEQWEREIIPEEDEEEVLLHQLWRKLLLICLQGLLVAILCYCCLLHLTPSDRSFRQ